jgi:hypothetical protein
MREHPGYVVVNTGKGGKRGRIEVHRGHPLPEGSKADEVEALADHAVQLLGHGLINTFPREAVLEGMRRVLERHGKACAQALEAAAPTGEMKGGTDGR